MAIPRILEDMVYAPGMGVPIPQESSLSTMHGLSKQVRGTTGRPGRVPTLRSGYHEEGMGFTSAPFANVSSGGMPRRRQPEQPSRMPTTRTTQRQTTTPNEAVFGGGGPGGGAGGPGGMGDAGGAVGEAVGQGIASNIGTAGLASGSQLGVTGAVMGAPTSAIASAAPGAFISGALSPLGLANSIGGGLISGQQAKGMESDLVSRGMSPEQAEEMAVSAVQASPKTLSGLAKSLFSSKKVTVPEMHKAVLSDMAHGLVAKSPQADIMGSLDPGTMANLAAYSDKTAPVTTVSGLPTGETMSSMGPKPAPIDMYLESIGPGDVSGVSIGGAQTGPGSGTTAATLGQELGTTPGSGGRGPSPGSSSSGSSGSSIGSPTGETGEGLGAGGPGVK